MKEKSLNLLKRSSNVHFVNSMLVGNFFRQMHDAIPAEDMDEDKHALIKDLCINVDGAEKKALMWEDRYF